MWNRHFKDGVKYRKAKKIRRIDEIEKKRESEVPEP